jgi:hypothetical protein
LVTITAEKNGGSSGRNEIVHIYNGLTSEFGTDAAPIVFSAADFTAIPLTANLWADGNLSANGTQWFSFTATAATQYINVNFGTLTDLYVQLYDNAGVAVGTETNLYGSTRSISRTVTPGAVYYVKVRPYSGSGAYKVAFSTTAAVTLPSTGVTVLAYQNFWSNGSIPASNGTQWFRFTATAATQYIHVNFGTLDDLYVQLYDDAGLAVGTETNLYSGIRNISRTVTTGSVYYVKVRPYSTYTGTYWIGFNASSSGIPSLIENTLKSGNIPTAGGTQWFSFTATAATQYIHVTFNTLTDLYVQLYDSTGATVGAESNLWSTTRYISRTVTPGNVYYIKVRPYSTYTGTYSIGFNASSTAPSP